MKRTTIAIHKLRFFILASLVLTCATSSVHAVTWESQAERLQMVSASLLDAQPLLSPLASGFRVEAKSVVSVLPKMNATVGAKTEQPPQPPAHMIPTLELGYQTRTLSFSQASLRGWAGYLPSKSSQVTGMSASCEQTSGGASLGLSKHDLSMINLKLDLGMQASSAKVLGAITAPDSEDVFAVSSQIVFGSLTLSERHLPEVWAQMQVAERKVKSHFEITSDDTVFDLKDSSTLRGGSAASQYSLGYHWKNGLQTAVSYLIVPQRVSMPRFLLSYSVTPFESHGGSSNSQRATSPEGIL